MTITGQAFQSGTCANFSTHFWCCSGGTKMFWSGGSKTPLYFCLPWTKTWMDAQVSQLTQHRVQNKLNSQYLALPYTIDCTHTHTHTHTHTQTNTHTTTNQPTHTQPHTEQLSTCCYR